jgi:hypothetical protein
MCHTHTLYRACGHVHNGLCWIRFCEGHKSGGDCDRHMHTETKNGTVCDDCKEVKAELRRRVADKIWERKRWCDIEKDLPKHY